MITFNVAIGFILLALFIITLVRYKQAEPEQEFKWTIPPEIKWQPPDDYKSGVYTLTFDHINFYETRDGIYRHYRIEEKPIDYPRPVSKEKQVNKVWQAYEQDLITANEIETAYNFANEYKPGLGIHSPASFEDEIAQELNSYEWEERYIPGYSKPIRVRVK